MEISKMKNINRDQEVIGLKQVEKNILSSINSNQQGWNNVMKLFKQWVWNKSDNPDQQCVWENYPCIETVLIESSYQKYTVQQDPGYRVVIIAGVRGTYSVDLEYMIQYNTDDPDRQRRIRRIETPDDAIRPTKSLRFCGDIEMISGS